MKKSRILFYAFPLMMSQNIYATAADYPEPDTRAINQQQTHPREPHQMQQEEEQLEMDKQAIEDKRIQREEEDSFGEPVYNKNDDGNYIEDEEGF